MNKSVALVTGASQGIGHATAMRLARDFSGIVLAARNRAALAEVAGEVERAGAEPSFVIELDPSRGVIAGVFFSPHPTIHTAVDELFGQLRRQ